MKEKFLVFKTDFTAEMVSSKVKDGKTVIGNKEFEVDKTRPFTLKTAFGNRVFYLLKWNSLYPMTFAVKEDVKTYRDDTGKELQVKTQELVSVEPEFYEKGGAGYSPEMLKTTTDVRFLKGFRAYAGEGRDWKNILSWVLGITIFLAAGFLIWQLILQGGIKI